MGGGGRKSKSHFRVGGRVDCEKSIKELKADFGLSSLVLRDFWATEAALGAEMLTYN